jgi:O-antigen/teichoic acid export membrane protein
MRLKLKQLAKDSIVYGFGDVAGKAILFLLLPVYTRIFVPIEYGSIETLTMLNNFLSIFLMAGMDGAQSFYFFEQKKFGKTAQTNVVTAIIQWRLIWGSVGVILATILSPLLNSLFFKGQLRWEYFAIAFSGALFVQLVGQCASVFQLLYRPLRFIGITLAYVSISSVISILLVVFFGWGIIGYFTGTCIGAGIAAIFGCWLIRDYLDFSKLHNEWWPKLLKFGSPFIFGELAMYALYTTDRWFIMHYQGQNGLGIYAVGAKFVIFVLVAVNAFRAAWWPMAMDTLHSENGHKLFQTVARLYLGLGVILVVLLTFLSPLLIKFLSGPAYHCAYPIIGTLSWYAIFYGFFLIISAGIFKKEKTLFLSIPMGIAGLINIVLNFFLVPRFGGIGAAIATSFSFFVLVLIIIIISEKFWPVKYPLGIFALQIGVGITGCWRILYIYQNNLPANQAGIIGFIVSMILISTLLKYHQYLEVFRYAKLKLIGTVK